MSVRSEATEPKRDLRATPHVGEEEEGAGARIRSAGGEGGVGSALKWRGPGPGIRRS